MNDNGIERSRQNTFSFFVVVKVILVSQESLRVQFTAARSFHYYTIPHIMYIYILYNIPNYVETTWTERYKKKVFHAIRCSSWCASGKRLEVRFINSR